MDTIRVEGLEVRCIVGLRPAERVRSQRVLVDLELGLETRSAARSGRIGQTVDYDRVAEQVSGLLRFRSYRLIEQATEEIAAFLFGAHRHLCTAEVHLAKPEALRGRARSVAVSVRRTRDDFPARPTRCGFGTLDVLLETGESSIALARVRPHASLPATAVEAGARLACLVEGAASTEDRRVPLQWGDVHTWAEHAPALLAGPEGASVSVCVMRG